MVNIRDEGKTKGQLMGELAELRLQVAELKALESRGKRTVEEVQDYAQNLVDSSLDMVIAVDKDRKVTEFNGAAQETFGYTREEIVGKHVNILYSSPQEGLTVHKTTMKTGRFTGEIANKRKNGDTFTSLISASILRDAMGRFIGVMGISRDITELKQTAEKLRRSDEKYRTLVENLRQCVILKDVDSRFISTNSSFCNMLGVTHRDIMGKSDYDLFPRELAEKYRDDDRRVIDKGETLELIEEHETKDGRRIWVEVVKTPVRDSQGNVTGVLVIFWDITERKRMEDELKDSVKRLEILFEFAPDGYYLNDIEGTFVDGNRAAEEITGYKRDELIGSSFMELKLLPPEHIPKAAENLARNAMELPTGSDEFVLNRKDGSQVTVEIRTYPVKIKDQPMVLGIARDITEKRKMEEEFLKVQKLESIGILAGGIAHDFNNILTAVSGNISLVEMYLEKGGSRSEILKRLKEADRASTLAKDLTHQLLTFSKGGVPIKELVSIVEVLKDTAAFALSGSNVICRFSIPDNLWPVEVDESQISQVISNLVINADQAMPGGGVVHVRAENVNIVPEHNLPLEAGEYIEIAIQDQGIGIPREHLQKIFDPFFTTKQKGSGLGLATSYSIVRKHNGHIAVESRIGTGSTFRIYLPASSEKVLMKESKEDDRPIMGEGRILVMDDEEYIRDLAGEMLGSIGYEVATSTDGAEAIELYKEAVESGQSYSAIIVDLTVPGGMGGVEAIQKLREIDPAVRAIVSSGYSNDPIMADFRRYGFQGIIAKPYKVQELSDVLREVVMGARD